LVRICIKLYDIQALVYRKERSGFNLLFYRSNLAKRMLASGRMDINNQEDILVTVFDGFWDMQAQLVTQ
jgi:hypothetical protein